jgi:hypothetical protein
MHVSEYLHVTCPHAPISLTLASLTYLALTTLHPNFLWFFL